MKELRYGDRGKEVKRLQRLLKKQGFFYGPISGKFLKLTLEAVYFQQTHLGPDGKFLEVDGIVGLNTWWALENASGSQQLSGIPSRIPRNLTPIRVRQLEIALKEHDDNVHEVPDGSNWGNGIVKYGGQKGWAWCCLFWSWSNRQAFGSYAVGARLARCFSAYERAIGFGMWKEKGNYIPIPGDAFVMLYRNDGAFTGRGHIGFVMRVRLKNGKATNINTIEGNCGNRVKNGERNLSDPDIVGFINNYPADEQPTDWEKGLVSAAPVAGDGTR